MTDGRDFIALSGDVRAMGEADDSINRIATERGRKFWLFIIYLLSIINQMSSNQISPS